MNEPNTELKASQLRAEALKRSCEETSRELRAAQIHAEDATAERQRVQRELSRVEKERDKARAACAEMREALLLLVSEEELALGEFENWDGVDITEQLKSALGTDAGKGFISREPAKALIEALKPFAACETTRVAHVMEAKRVLAMLEGGQ